MKRIANHVLLESITTKWVRTVKPSVKHAQQDTHNLFQEKHFVCHVYQGNITIYNKDLNASAAMKDDFLRK
jgi:hypothetical protein